MHWTESLCPHAKVALLGNNFHFKRNVSPSLAGRQSAAKGIRATVSKRKGQRGKQEMIAAPWRQEARAAGPAAASQRGVKQGKCKVSRAFRDRERRQSTKSHKRNRRNANKHSLSPKAQTREPTEHLRANRSSKVVWRPCPVLGRSVNRRL